MVWYCHGCISVLTFKAYLDDVLQEDQFQLL